MYALSCIYVYAAMYSHYSNDKLPHDYPALPMSQQCKAQNQPSLNLFIACICELVGELFHADHHLVGYKTLSSFTAFFLALNG